MGATAGPERDGWLYTGDLVTQDAEGYYWFAGRKKELIVRGSSNISPQEVEAVLPQHPAVAEAGVIGIPDETWGEVVVAYVARREGVSATEGELIEFAKKQIATHKVPEKVFFLPSLPKGAVGKVQRRALKEHYRSARQLRVPIQGKIARLSSRWRWPKFFGGGRCASKCLYRLVRDRSHERMYSQPEPTRSCSIAFRA